jgi:LmbE family N-acetylglucosaminyl deacetylase
MNESFSIPQRVMVVAAHPDDAEGGCGGTVAKWVRQGVEAYFLIATNGDKGDDEAKTTPEELATIRATESRAAAAILGVQELVILPRRDGELVYSIELRGDVVRYLRRWKPDLVLTHDPRVLVGARGGINHADHRAIGEATLDAVYPFARGRHQYPEQIAEGLQPHTVRDVFLWGANPPDHWEDVTEFVDRKIEALQQHHSQFPDPDRVALRTRERLGETGAAHGMGFAEGFAHISLRRAPAPPIDGGSGR